MNRDNYQKKIRLFITEKYGSQKRFAKVIGMSTQQLNQHMSVTRYPTLKTLQKFYKAGININWLLDDKLDSKDFELYLKIENIFKQIKEFYLPEAQNEKM